MTHLPPVTPWKYFNVHSLFSFPGSTIKQFNFNQKITLAGKGLSKCAHFHAFSWKYKEMHAIFTENAHIFKKTSFLR